MPQIPRYQRQVQSTSASMSRAPLDMEGSSPFIDLGAAIGNLGDQMDRARESSQLATAQSSWKEGMADFGNSLESDTDYATYEKRFDLYAKNLHKSIFSQITHRGASGIFGLWAKDSLVVEKAKIRHRANQLEVRFMEADYFKHLMLAVKREDRASIISETQSAIEAGYIDPVVGAKAREAALEKLDWTTAWNDIINIRDRDEVTAILWDTDLSVDKKNSLISNWEREQSFTRAREKEARNEAVTKIQDDFVGRINSLTPSEVHQSGLPPIGSGSKMFFLNLIEKKAKAIETEGEDPFTTTNYVLLAQLLLQNADPEQPALTTSGILDYVPMEDGLSMSVAQSLIKTVDVLKTSVFKNTEAALKHQFGYEGVMVGFGSKQLGAIYYNNAMTEILKELAETPLKGIALRDKMQEIAVPHLRQYMTEYGESESTVDKKLRLMGVRIPPATKIIDIPPERDTGKERKTWIPGKGWSTK